MSLFVHTRAGNAVRRPLGGWSRFLATGALCLGLAACGGGGGGGGTASTQPTTGLLVTVVDTYGATIAGATVEATVGSSRFVGTTGQDGRAVVPTPGAVGTASVKVSHDPFFDPTTVPATITASATTPLTVELVRVAWAAGGALSTRTPNYAPTITNGQTMTFEIELVIVNSDSEPVLGLDASNFHLLECIPDPNNKRADCVRGTNASFDAAYTPTNNGVPVSVEWVPGANQAVPYAAGLMLDQSASVAGSDPTGARLYSAKAFLDRLGLDLQDWVLLSAFADGAAKIANDPNAEMLGKPGVPKILSVYRSFRNKGTVEETPSYYSSLDSLAALVGGGTPLYDALDLLREEVVNDASVAGIAKSVVIFTDGDDTTCVTTTTNTCRERRQQSINAANAAGVRIFTIGLSSGVDFEALGELANKTGGAFLFAENSQQLIPLYGSVGRLLSLSLPTYRISWTVNTSTPNAFVPGNALLGRVEVDTGTDQFDVPFIFGITGTP